MVLNSGERLALSSMKPIWSWATSSSAKMAFAGHSGTHTAQSMHSSGSITRKFGPSRKQSTGHTSTQSVNLHLIQFSVTTCVIVKAPARSEEHTSELQSLMRISYAVFCLKKKKN